MTAESSTGRGPGSADNIFAREAIERNNFVLLGVERDSVTPPFNHLKNISPGFSAIDLSVRGGLKYLVGPAGQAPYQKIQNAIDDAKNDSEDQLIPVLPGVYEEDLIIDTDGIHIAGLAGVGDNSPVETRITEILGTVTYTGDEAQYISLSNILISDTLNLEGSEPIILWLNNVRISSDGAIAANLSNTNGITRIIGHDSIFNEVSGSFTVIDITGGASLFLNDCQITTNDGTLSAQTAIATTAGGDGLNLTNCFINGKILKTSGSAGATIRGAATVIQVASGFCIERTGGSGLFFLLNTNFYSGGGGVISGGAGSNFVQGIALQFGTALDYSIVGVIPLAGEFAYNAADAADWSGSAPATVTAALDRIAAALGPIA